MFIPYVFFLVKLLFNSAEDNLVGHLSLLVGLGMQVRDKFCLNSMLMTHLDNVGSSVFGNCHTC